MFAFEKGRDNKGKEDKGGTGVQEYKSTLRKFYVQHLVARAYSQVQQGFLPVLSESTIERLSTLIDVELFVRSVHLP